MVAKENSGDFIFKISQEFDAPIEFMWKLWTECEHLKHWWGPKGFKVTVCKIDLTPGGLFHYCLHVPDGSDMWGKFVFRKIDKPKRLEFVTSFSDEKGGITTHPLNPDWPRELLSIIEFEESNGKTKVSVNWQAINATENERRTFEDNAASMKQGWGGTFENLSTYLAEQK